MDNQVSIISKSRIEKLRQAVQALFGSLHQLKQEQVPIFINTIRKLFLYELYRDDYIIAVSGIQGTGKSTVVNLLYGYEYFPVLRGRGENIPILVREAIDITSPEDARFYAYMLVQADEACSMEKRIISRQEFLTLSITPTAHCLHLEVELPVALNLSPTMALLVLPGQQNLPGNPWQDLLRSAIATSSQHIVVVNFFQLREGGNTRMYANIQDCLGGQQPIMIITHMDGTDYSEQKVLEDVVGRFSGLRPESVGFSGMFVGENSRVDSLREWIQSKLLSDDYTRQKQVGFHTDIQNTLRHDLLQMLETAKQSMSIESPDEVLSKIDDYMDVFNIEADRIKASFRVQIKNRLRARHSHAVEKAKEEEFRKPVERILVRVKNIFGFSEMPTELIGKMQGLWNTAGGRSMSEDGNDIIRSVTKELAGLEQSTTDRENHLPTLRNVDESTIKAMRYLASFRPLTNTQAEPLPPDEITKAVRLTPYLSLVLMSYGTYLQLETALADQSVGVNSVSLKKVIDESREEMAQTLRATMDTLKVVGVFLGMDYLPDGKLDLTIPAFASGLVKTLGLSTSVVPFLTAALSWSMVGIASVSMVSSFLKAAAKDENDRQQYILQTLNSIRLETEAELQKDLSKILAHIGKELRYLIGRSLNYDGALNQKYLTTIHRNRVKEMRQSLLNDLDIKM